MGVTSVSLLAAFVQMFHISAMYKSVAPERYETFVADVLVCGLRFLQGSAGILVIIAALLAKRS